MSVETVNSIVLFLLPIALTAITLAAGTWIVTHIIEVRHRLGAEADATLHELINKAVMFAEQVGLRDALESEAKKLLATQKVKEWLADKGLAAINVDKISDLIEAAVMELFNKGKGAWTGPLTAEPLRFTEPPNTAG